MPEAKEGKLVRLKIGEELDAVAGLKMEGSGENLEEERGSANNLK